MSGGITVKEFKHIPGVNDAEYIKKLEELNEINKGIISKAVAKIKMLSAQPERKGTRLSTVCLMCKKPAVTFNTEDDIPYTNYSYCEDCLRKGLKLLREQKKKERKDAIEKAVAVEAISDELMSRFDVSATYGYDFAEAVINRIEAMAKELERGEQE